MGLFSRNKKTVGWLAIVPSAEGMHTCHIVRPPSAKPSVEWIAHFPPAKASGDKALEKLARELHVERYQCTTLLAANEYQLVSVDAPNVPQDELKTAIRWRLKDMLDFRVDDATIDVLDVPVDQEAAARGHSMYAVAARNQVIEQRQTQFGDAKIPLSAIDIPDLAQRNISALLESEGRGVAMLSFGNDGGLLTVTYNGELYLSRRIDLSLSQLMQVCAQESERTACFERITLELQRSFDHLDRQYHFISLSKLFLAPLPGAVLDAGLAGYLAENLYTAVEVFGLEAVFDLAKVQELHTPEKQQHFFFALGAALRLEETVP